MEEIEAPGAHPHLIRIRLFFPAQPTPPHYVSWAYGTDIGQCVLGMNK